VKDIIHQDNKEDLNYIVCSNRDAMGKYAANLAATKIKSLLKRKEEVRIIFASAPSQNEFLHYLTEDKEIDWSRVVGFHMDEYIGLPKESDQWFKIYLEKNLLSKVTFKYFHFIDGMKDPDEMEDLYTSLLNKKQIDMVCLGVGENGHIAFNDPPVADFEDPKMVKKVMLDKYSRQQQVNDGCFPHISDVPTHALSLTIPALTQASTMICVVPGVNKKEAIYKLLHDDITTNCPATIMRRHDDANLIMDEEAYGKK